MKVRGLAARRFGPVGECFAAIVAGQPGTGAAFAAWSEGRLVVDLWGGYADVGRRRMWDAGSVVQPYSVSKPFAAVCALRLVQDGRLDLDAPVQRYWPGFRAAATVRHVLSHQAGVVMLDRQLPTGAFYDWDWLCALLAAQPPAWEPGTAHGESPLFYGHLVGELVRRVDGRSVGRFLAEEVVTGWAGWAETMEAPAPKAATRLASSRAAPEAMTGSTRWKTRCANAWAWSPSRPPATHFRTAE